MAEELASLAAENARLRAALGLDGSASTEEMAEAVEDLRASIGEMEAERAQLVEQWNSLRDETVVRPVVDTLAQISGNAERTWNAPSTAGSLTRGLADVDVDAAYACARARVAARCPGDARVNELAAHVETLRAFRERLVAREGATPRDGLAEHAAAAADAAFAVGALALMPDEPTEVEVGAE